VSYFKDEAEVYRYLGALFEELLADPELGPQLMKADTIVQYRYRDPDSEITVKLLEGEEGRVETGATELDPELVMTMDADIAHRFWLGKVNPTTALARGQMRAKGPIAKLLKLVPVVRPAFPRYRRLLEEAGREDLAQAA
jgi:hypothetical protein